MGIEHPDPIVESRYVSLALVIIFSDPHFLCFCFFLRLPLHLPLFILSFLLLSSLSSVDPPQVWFDLKFPREVVEEAKLSSLQLEAVVYSCQQHMNILADGTRAGFLIGRKTLCIDHLILCRQMVRLHTRSCKGPLLFHGTCIAGLSLGWLMLMCNRFLLSSGL